MALYYVDSNAVGSGTGLSWANAAANIGALITAQSLANGDIVYLAHNHDGQYSANTTLNLNDNLAVGNIVYYLSVTSGTTTLQAGAKERVITNNSLTLQNSAYVYGVEFNVGTGTSATAAVININSNAGHTQSYDACIFYCLSTYTVSARIGIGPSGATNQQLVRFRSCVFKSAGAGATIQSSRCDFAGCSFDATYSATGFLFTSSQKCSVFMSGCDWTNTTNLFNVSATSPHDVFIINSKVPSSLVTGTHQGLGAMIVEAHSCSSSTTAGAVEIYNYYRQTGSDVVVHDTAYYLTSGGSTTQDGDGTSIPYSLKLTPTTTATRYFPAYSGWITQFNSSTGAGKTVSIQVAYDSASTKTNSGLWLEVEFLGEDAVANTTQSWSKVSAPTIGATDTRDPTNAGSALTDTGDAWTGTFSSGQKNHTLSVTCDIDHQGYIRARIGASYNAAVPSIYIDRKLTVA